MPAFIGTRAALLGGGVFSLASAALQEAGLAFDARDMSAVVKGHTTNFDGDANSLFTNASPSPKYVRNASGLYVSGTTMRCDHDASGNKLGLLIEEQRTNLLLRSAEFDNASWTKTNTTVTADQVAAPHGTISEDKVEASSTTSERRQDVTVTGTSATLSAFFKKGSSATGMNVMAIRSQTGGTTLLAASLNLDTGAITYITGSSGAVAIDCGNGWWFFYMTATITSGHTIRSSVGNNGSAITSGAFSYIWGAQLEPGSFPTSYIPTAGSQVTRAADTITLATTAFPFSATAGILVVEARAALGAGTHVLIQIDDGTANERIRIVRNTSNEIHCIVTDGGVDQCDLNLGSVSNDTAFKVAFSWAANDFAACLNGGAVQTDTGGTLPTVTTLRLGSGNSAYWNGRLRRAKHLPRNRASDAELQALAA